MKHIKNIRSNKGILGIICGSLLVAIPAISFTSVALPESQTDPDPNTPAETAPSNDGNPGTPRTDDPAATPATPPLPEEQQPPSATVVPVNGTVNVRLVNQTYTNITYQAIGDTKPRTLSGRSDVTLQNLKLPVTITFQRPDRGLLLVRPQSSEVGMLEVPMTETTDLGTDKTSMTIQENGNVFLN
jgi:hypothetical protein